MTRLEKALVKTLKEVLDFEVASHKDATGEQMLDDLSDQFMELQEHIRLVVTVAEHEPYSDLDALGARLDKAGYGTLGKDGKRCRLTF